MHRGAWPATVQGVAKNWTRLSDWAPHSSTLAWKILWTEEPGRLQSMGLLRVGHDWATSLSFSLSCIGEGNGNPLQCSCLENPRDRGAWWAAVSGVTQSWTRLKWLSSSSSSKRLRTHAQVQLVKWAGESGIILTCEHRSSYHPTAAPHELCA